MTEIVVVGSANLDIVVPVPHHPVRGETVLGGDHSQVPGGKGANQAVASSRLGGDVSFVGCVGSDAAGSLLRKSLVESGVNVDYLRTAADVPSGIALIAVGPDGDNSIIVSPGANRSLLAEHVADNPLVIGAKVLQLQLEIPLETTIAAAQACRGTVLLDPAPAPPHGLPSELLDEIDLVIPNETELGLLAGRVVNPDDLDDIVDAARGLGVADVIVTLGKMGAVVVTSGGFESIPSPTITAVDTTGAGDAFRSAVAVGVAQGLDLVSAAKHAVRVGAATALRFGAQPSLPTAAEVDGLLQ